MGLKHRKGIPAGVARLAELRSQRSELNRQFEQLEQEERRSIVDIARALIEEYGLTAADFAPAKKRVPRSRKPGTPKGSKVAPKFRHPTTGDTWSGRGSQPRWLKAALTAGRELSEFMV